MKWISSLFVALIIGFNFYLYTNTKKKVFLYNQIPPFIWLDHTNSEWKNSNSKLKYLFDKNSSTYWKKERKSLKEWDVELELELTHTFQNGTYIPKTFKAIKIIPCSNTFWKWEIFLNEAINVDKVLRLPIAKPIFSSEYESFEKEKEISLPNLNLKPTSQFDENLFILGIRFQSEELGGCISEIEVLK